MFSDKQIKSRMDPPDTLSWSVERTKASLCIYPDLIGVEEVSSYLGIEPTEAHNKGTTILNSIGRARVTSRNYWSLSSEGKVESLDVRHHMDWLITTLDGAKDRLLALQSMDGIQMRVSVVWVSEGASGPVLWPEQMIALAKLNLSLAFDIYYYSSELMDGRIINTIPSSLLEELNNNLREACSMDEDIHHG